ncbi:hypothetical protein BP5796_05694 [Coleophoma crateriformis]|uniref:Uncharacterized protein n=1 Tax=Coleophoma crateriformis TaxID=565419 RepID=A0A3D8RUU5_9HELO|nr:hypothetical protein BP5796_05694 [Coleophoma crateriformis]
MLLPPTQGGTQCPQTTNAQGRQEDTPNRSSQPSPLITQEEVPDLEISKSQITHGIRAAKLLSRQGTLKPRPEIEKPTPIVGDPTQRARQLVTRFLNEKENQKEIR